MTRSDPPMPVIFGLPLKGALSALSTAGVVVARVLDITGRDVAPANPPDAFLNSQVLAHLPDAGAPVPGSQGAQLVISAALEVEPSVVVPSLAGLTLSESRTVLENLGLVLGDVQTRS
jgi:beta-lactam-binding protein with PASTA domain